MVELAKQYNHIAGDFSRHQARGEHSNRLNREVFYRHLDFLTPGMRLLDLGCGDGTDFAHYQALGAEIYGVDASKELLKIAKAKLPAAKLSAGDFANLPLKAGHFDAVLSKYAIMTSANMEPVFQEMHRVLKPGGMMMYLVTYPLRQYLERREGSADYFEQKIVDSHILGNTVTVREPTHTMTEYFTPFLFKHFDVQAYDEQWDPAAEVIEGKKYPGFFILKARKRPEAI
jgi:ubiquinone/menaquinone biosynthesis C-methylase UbiE